MNICFGESLRRLRREKGLTQEQLAARLNVSFQTISNWERDESWPDLSMLPVLADFFGVTTDALLAVDRAANERRVQDIIEDFDKRRTDAVDILPKLKEALAEFPLDYRLRVRYMECLLRCAHGLEGGLAVEKEVRDIYENIVAYCTDDNIRMWAKRLFVMHLHSLAQPLEPGGPLGRPDLQTEAERTLDEMPDMKTCREHLAIMVSQPGEGHIRAVQSALVELMWMIRHALFHHDDYGLAFPHEEATHPRAREIVYSNELFLRMNELFYPDGDYGEQFILIIKANGYLAFYNAMLGNYDEAFAAMSLCLEQAVVFDALPRVTVHTSPLFKGLAYDKITQDRGMAQRMQELFGNRYPWPENFKADPRFGEVMAMLE